MIRQNLHTHSTFDDGQNTMDEMVQAALAAGLSSIGFSIHTPMPYRNVWTISIERLPDYISEARRLREAYRGRIAVHCGAEWDLYSETPLEPFDYVIGSVHHIENGESVNCVDSSPETTASYLSALFGGDTDAAAEAYFRQYDALSKITGVDIVGHFDLLTKFDETDHFYNADSSHFQDAARAAMDALVGAGKIFEINTGAVARGFRTKPYPARALLAELADRKGRITISSDAHSAGGLTFGFDEAERLARDCGFAEIWQYNGSAFEPVPLKGA